METSSKLAPIVDSAEQLQNVALDAAKKAAKRIQNSTTNEKLAAGAVALGVVAGAAVAAYKATKGSKKRSVG